MIKIKIYIFIIFTILGTFPAFAQVEKYDTRIDSEIELENKITSGNSKKTLFGSELEDKMLDKVWDFPEVRRRDEYLKHISKGKRQLGIVIYQRHIGEKDYYWVKVGEDFGGMIITHFNYYVEPKTLTVYFYDAERGVIVDLATWRKSQR